MKANHKLRPRPIPTPVYILLFFLFTATHLPLKAKAQDVFIYVGKKEEQKKQTRWSLGEWMATKQRISLMDQWLSVHSSNPFFEGVISGDTGTFQEEPGNSKYRLTEGQLSLYFSIFGLEAKYEEAKRSYNSRSLGMALRLMGAAVQGTHLTFQAGLRHFNEAYVYDNTYLGGQLSLYLWHFFGIEGLYRFYMVKAAKDNPLSKLKGRRIEAGAFIDIKYFRIYGTWFNEQLDTETAGTTITKKYHGVLTGLKLFF